MILPRTGMFLKYKTLFTNQIVENETMSDMNSLSGDEDPT